MNFIKQKPFEVQDSSKEMLKFLFSKLEYVVLWCGILKKGICKKDSHDMQEYKAAKLNLCNLNFASQTLLPSPHRHAVQAGSLLQGLTFTLRRTSCETPVDLTQYVVAGNSFVIFCPLCGQ